MAWDRVRTPCPNSTKRVARPALLGGFHLETKLPTVAGRQWKFLALSTSYNIPLNILILASIGGWVLISADERILNFLNGLAM